MKAITQYRFGGPEVLKIAEVPPSRRGTVHPDAGKPMGW
jgi:hypothetical protein